MDPVEALRCKVKLPSSQGMVQQRRTAQVRPDQSFKDRLLPAEVILWVVR